jgi:hypothetical protein
MIVALIALVVALSGTAVAAGRYLITSTTQIKPSVRRDLRAEASATAVKIAKQGAHSVVARARFAGPISLTEEAQPVTLTGNTWTQGAEEVDEIVGDVTTTSAPPCGTLSLQLSFFLDGIPTSGEVLLSHSQELGTFRSKISWPEKLAPLLVLDEPGASTKHTLTAEARETSCSAMTLDSIRLDVIGAR